MPPTAARIALTSRQLLALISAVAFMIWDIFELSQIEFAYQPMVVNEVAFRAKGVTPYNVETGTAPLWQMFWVTLLIIDVFFIVFAAVALRERLNMGVTQRWQPKTIEPTLRPAWQTRRHRRPRASDTAVLQARLVHVEREQDPDYAQAQGSPPSWVSSADPHGVYAGSARGSCST